MRKVIQEGVKTRVLMLSATPVNNRWPTCEPDRLRHRR
jgi:hypothetical protein